MLYTRGLGMVFLLTFLARSCRHISWPTPGHGCNLLFSAAEHRTSADRESPPHSSTHHLNRHGLATWISAGLVCLGWRPSAPRWHTYIIVTWSEFANTRDWIPLTCYVNLMLMIVVNVHVVDFVDTWRLCDGKVCCVLYVRPVHAQLVGGPQSGVFSRAPLRPY